MRLIDADALMHVFENIVKQSNNSDLAKVPTWNDAVSLVDLQATVYDIDKVVERLSELKEEAEHDLMWANSFRIAEREQRLKGIVEAIEIVKKGGKE